MIGLQELIHLQRNALFAYCVSFLSMALSYALRPRQTLGEYRKIVAIFILLTAFSIIYLGIHWFSDIIGGMVVAVLAVHLSEKSQFVWNYLDERTINSRISALLSNPNKSFAIIKNGIKQSTLKFKKPGSSETTALIIGLLFVVGATVTWDLTHQALPAKGLNYLLKLKHQESGW